MKVLWICNIVLPVFAEKYNIKKDNMGGWMSSLSNLLIGNDEIEIGFCFPIYDQERRKDFVWNNQCVFSFDGQMDRQEYSKSYVEEFISIFRRFSPDIIHIWGTEYKHAYYSVLAAERIGKLNSVLIDVQGLSSYITPHYYDGIPLIGTHNYTDEYLKFSEQSKYEKEIIKKTKQVTGRTDWDLGGVRCINPIVKYFHNSRVLREGFYNNAGQWNYNVCNRHTIFISNASYPIKGFHLFLDILPYLCEKYDDLKVVIAGVNPTIPDKNGEVSRYGEYLSKRSVEVGVNNCLHWVGILDEEEIIEEMMKANIFVATSVVENSCNSLCEAMMLGVPSVAAYSGGLPSLITHGIDGFLYQTNEPHMGAYYIEKVFDDAHLTEKISAAGHETAIKRHNKNDIKANILKIYEEIIGY